jgi:hypothetical protein
MRASAPEAILTGFNRFREYVRNATSSSGTVEKLWMNGAFPVDGLSSKIFFGTIFSRQDKPRVRVRGFSRPASLVSRFDVRTIHRAPQQSRTRNRRDTVNTAVHHFEELIGGHPYSIEVVAVAKDRWRAYVVRIPGMPNAMMPFYGATPDQAAERLRLWLTRAYERAAGAAVRKQA